MVFDDSYEEGSVKDTERSRRATVKPIEISTVAEDTPIPVNMDTFWASITNKATLQALLRKWVPEKSENKCPEVEIVFSNFYAQRMSFPCQILKEDCLMSLPELDLNIEEADVRLTPHAMHATRTGAKRLVILDACWGRGFHAEYIFACDCGKKTGVMHSSPSNTYSNRL